MTCHLGRLCFPTSGRPGGEASTSIPLTVANFAAIFFDHQMRCSRFRLDRGRMK